MRRIASVLGILLGSAAACSTFGGNDDVDAGAPDGGDSGSPDGSPADATGDEADAADAGPPRLTAVWSRELTMKDGGSVGASVAAAAGGNGVHVLFSGTGEIGGVVAADDAVLARVHADGGLGPVTAHGGAGDQSARAVMVDADGRTFVSWLHYASAIDWQSYVRRVDVDAGSAPVSVDPGGATERDHLIALAPFAGGNFFYSGISGRRLLMGVGTNAPSVLGDGINEAIALAAAGTGDGVVFSGRTASALSFGNGCELTPSSPANALGFVAKMSNALECVWRTPLLSTGSSEASAVAARNGIVVAAGPFSGTFGPTGQTATNGMWLARLNPQTGDVLWARSFTSQGTTLPRAAVVDARGLIVVVGGVANSVDIDGRTIAAAGSPCAFVAVFDSAGGTLLDAIGFGEAGVVSAFAVDVGPANEIYVGGTAYKGAAVALAGSSPASPVDRSFVARFAF